MDGIYGPYVFVIKYIECSRAHRERFEEGL